MLKLMNNLANWWKVNTSTIDNLYDESIWLEDRSFLYRLRYVYKILRTDDGYRCLIFLKKIIFIYRIMLPKIYAWETNKMLEKKRRLFKLKN